MTASLESAATAAGDRTAAHPPAASEPSDATTTPHTTTRHTTPGITTRQQTTGEMSTRQKSTRRMTGGPGSGPMPVRPATVRRALGRVLTGTVRTHPEPRRGAPGMSPRTLHTLDTHGLVRLGTPVPGLGQPVRATRAANRTLLARGSHGLGVWAELLAQGEVWMSADGSRVPIRDMAPRYCGNAAAWLQRHAAASRGHPAPRSRAAAGPWMDATPLMRALVAAAEE